MTANDTLFQGAPDNENALFWFAIQTRHRHEKRIAARLREADIETFLPLHRSSHRWKNGVTARVDLPLFPSYLFTRVKRSDRLRLLREPGVLSIAASNASPTPIADADMLQLRLAAAGLQAEPHPYLAVGERVRVVAGVVAGLEGILVRRKNELRVVVSIEAIMRSVTVEVSEFEIEPLRVARALTA